MGDIRWYCIHGWCLFPLHVIYDLLFVKKKRHLCACICTDKKHALHREPKKIYRKWNRELAEKTSTMHVNEDLSAREQENRAGRQSRTEKGPLLFDL